MAGWIDKLDPLKIFSSLNPPNLTRELRWVGWVQLGGQRFSLLFFFFPDTWTKSNMILRVFQFLLPLPKQFQRLPLSQNNTFHSLFLISLNSHSHSSASPIHHGGFLHRLAAAAEHERQQQQDVNGSGGTRT